ncbi:hypothetical protein BIZ37_03170 [Photobacterium sp. BZF1]|uniref:hypothetical protein n=1 Tax=Photobacterium sp. BZF1 TaxID=1904457 RepID=UPI0016539D1B|nr:hypothetical protein [Photobacterium sp. BZF1]MBC7001548.1 hypothetical protein [Photobacterium sp. BZF1]
MTEQQKMNVKEEAPSWVLSFLITLLLTMQLTVRADDITAQKIDIMDGDTLYAWDENWLAVDTEQHIHQLPNKADSALVQPKKVGQQ